jgi:hypothetical protein
MLTILANLKIDSPVKVQHLVASFLSFNKISDNWLINIRGSYRKETIKFLKSKLGNKMINFELLNDKKGWSKNSLEMLKTARNDYILIWNEDHLNVSPQSVYKKVVLEMEKKKADYLFLSWWRFGKYRKAFNAIPLKEEKYIDFLYLTRDKWKLVLKNEYPYYLISLVGIFRKKFLRKLLSDNSIKLPTKATYLVFALARLINRIGIKIERQKFYQMINELFFFRLRKYSDETPFEVEKGPERYDMLPIRLAVPKFELFACIDDDLGVPGYQLIKRGLYPPRTRRFRKICLDLTNRY